MKKYFIPSSLFLYLISFITFFFVGASTAGFFGLADGQGLAGGAIILGYGLLGSIIALIISIFVVYACSHKLILWANVVMASLTAIMVLYFYLNFQDRFNEQETDQVPTQLSPTA